MYRLTLVCLVFVASAVTARADGTLNESMTLIAGDIQKYLKEKGETSVSLGQFRNTGHLPASGGPGLVHALEFALTRLGVEVKLNANVTILGDFEEVEDEKTAKQVVELKVEVRRKKPNEKIGLEARFLKNRQAIDVLAGITVSYPPDATLKEKNAVQKHAIDKPDVYTAETLIRCKEKSPFAIQILAAGGKGEAHKDEDYKLRNIAKKEGFAFVDPPLKQDEVYGVMIVNDADFDAAVELRIDNLSMYTFSSKEFRDAKTDLPKFTHVIIKAKSKHLIRGWHVTNDNSDEFLITEYAKSAAGKFQSSANLGTISVTFHAAWDRKTGLPPADEPKNPDNLSMSGDATGRGKRFEKKYVEVDYQVGVVRDVVSVRYAK